MPYDEAQNPPQHTQIENMGLGHTKAEQHRHLCNKTRRIPRSIQEHYASVERDP